MAVITATTLEGSGSRAATVTTLSASDTFAYNDSQVLVINNITAGAITPNLVGDSATTKACAGVGQIDVSAGYTSPSIAIGESAVIPLKSVSAYLAGTSVTVTGGDGAEVYLLSN